MAVEDGLIARYNCDGTAVDETGITGDAVPSGATYTTPGKIFSQASLFDLVNDNWDIPATGINNDNEAFSCGGWNNFSNAPSSREAIVACGTGSGAGATKFQFNFVRSTTGGLHFQIGRSQAWSVNVNSNVNNMTSSGTDYHAFITYDGSRTTAGIKLYLDGVEVTDVTVIGSFSTAPVVNDDWYFGTDSADLFDLGAKQNQMLIYNQVVSAADILAIYDAGVAGIDIFAPSGVSHASSSIYDKNFNAFSEVNSTNTIV
jgi:hypothetical protein